MSSDHLPITVSFVFSAEKETPATTSKYNYDLANWDLRPVVGCHGRIATLGGTKNARRLSDSNG